MIWFTLEFCNPSLSFTATLCPPIIWLLYHLKGHPTIQLAALSVWSSSGLKVCSLTMLAGRVTEHHKNLNGVFM